MTARHLPGEHNQDSHGDGTGEAKTALKDALKLAGDIELAPGETLLGSDKVTSSDGVIRLALTDRDGDRSLRLGLGGPGFGDADDEAGPWTGGPNRPTDPDADAPGGYTAQLDEVSTRRLRETLSEALAAGVAKQREIDAAFDAGDDEPDRPTEGYWTFADGAVSGQWANVHYLALLDDPTVGVEFYLGAVPPGSTFDDIQAADQVARLGPAEMRKLLRVLDRFTSTDRSGVRHFRHLSVLPAPEGDPGGRPVSREVDSAMRTAMRPNTETGLAEREVPFEMRSSSDGLTFEGYAAVFDSPTSIDSWEGQFDEVVVRGAFVDTLRQRMPVLMFEHGKHPLIGTMPLGVIVRAAEDSKGLHIEARLSDNWLIQPVRDAVRDKAVKGMSFRFTVADGGEKWERRTGRSDLRTLTRLLVPELGPVVFPAYEPTTASVRSLVERLPDFTGQPGARSAGGGDLGTQPRTGEVPPIPARTRADDDALRLRGILK